MRSGGGGTAKALTGMVAQGLKVAGTLARQAKGGNGHVVPPVWWFTPSKNM